VETLTFPVVTRFNFSTILVDITELVAPVSISALHPNHSLFERISFGESEETNKSTSNLRFISDVNILGIKI
jgi:hypothetical protein